MTTSPRTTVSIALAVALSCFVLGMTEQPAFAADSDPTTSECLEANETSIARRKAHKLLDARAQLLVCAATSCPAEVREECTRRITEVSIAIPTVVFVIRKASGGADVMDAVVTMDEKPFPMRADGIAVEVDPGEHIFTFEVQGVGRESRRIVLHEGEKNRREEIVLGNAEAPPPPLPPTTTTQPQPSTPARPGAEPKAEPSPFRTVGLVSAGVGAAALGVSLLLGLIAIGQRDAANCPNGVCEDEVGAAKYHDAIGTASVGTGFLVVGGLLTAGGLAMYLFAPSAPSAPPSSPPPPVASKGWSVKLANNGGAVGYTGSW